MQKTHRPSPTQAYGLRARGKAHLMILQTREEINRDLDKTTSSQTETGSYDAVRDDDLVKERIFQRPQ